MDRNGKSHQATHASRPLVASNSVKIRPAGGGGNDNDTPAHINDYGTMMTTARFVAAMRNNVHGIHHQTKKESHHFNKCGPQVGRPTFSVKQ